MPLDKAKHLFACALALTLLVSLMLVGLVHRSAAPAPPPSAFSNIAPSQPDERRSDPTAFSARGGARPAVDPARPAVTAPAAPADAPAAMPSASPSLPVLVPSPTPSAPAGWGTGGGIDPALPAINPAPPAVAPAPVPAPPPPTPTATPDPRPPEVQAGKPFVYTIKPGDTLSGIAKHYGLTVDSIVWANESLEEDRDFIREGRTLLLPPVSGVLHTVVRGDTLLGIAAQHKVDASAITGFAANGVQSSSLLQIGQVLVVPGGKTESVARYAVAAAPATAPAPQTSTTAATKQAPTAKAAATRFIWPLHGLLTQYFSASHLAIDIYNKQGTPIVAAAAGTVTYVGDKPGGFGLAVAVDHGDGYSALYSHMSAFSVEVGQHVEQGQQLGLVGQTGRATGPHLDFRIYIKGGAVDPLQYLP